MDQEHFELPVPHVSDTAWLVAELRAIESERPDAHFHDPLARKLLGDKGPKILELFGSSIATDFLMSVRTKVIDEVILKTVELGVDTVINLAAGLDTRPYRLELPPTLRWIEADYPALIDFKNDKLAEDQPKCKLLRRGMDLAIDADRKSFLKEETGKSDLCLVLTEGLLYYLTENNVAALATELLSYNSVQWWVMDVMNKGFKNWMRERYSIKSSGGKGTGMPFTPDDMIQFIVNYGWKKAAFYSYATEAARLNRLPSEPWSPSTQTLQENSGITVFTPG
jgi:methyltransferase (TIGR00027 family)